MSTGPPRSVRIFDLSEAIRPVRATRATRQHRRTEGARLGIPVSTHRLAGERTSMDARGLGMMLRSRLGTTATAPTWLELPAMMRVVLSTPLVVDRLGHYMRPYNFVLCPLIDGAVGYPSDLDRTDCTSLRRFRRIAIPGSIWSASMCEMGGASGSPWPRMCGGAKSFRRRTVTCCNTTGITRNRNHSALTASHAISAHGDCCSGRRWSLERGTSLGRKPIVVGNTARNLSLKNFKAMEYRPARRMVTADATTRREIASIGIRPMIRRTGMSQHTLEAIRNGRSVRGTTLQRVTRALGR